MPSPEPESSIVLPPAWVDRVHRDFADHPDVADRIIASTEGVRHRGIRLNPLQGPIDETLAMLDAEGLAGSPVDGLPWARVVREEDVSKITALSAWTEGRVVVQSITSMLAAVALQPRPGERILDLCAAPGGKSAAIAALVDGDLELIANDRSRTRCHRMRAFLKQCGVEAAVRPAAGERLPLRDTAAFDRVLVDAPCSGEGRFRADQPETFATWSVKGVRRLASTQKALLHAALHAVRPGGVVVYATCTLGRTENEAVVERALERYGDELRLELDPLPADVPPGLPLLDPPGPDADTAMRRFAPDRDGDPIAGAMDGFFLARIRRG